MANIVVRVRSPEGLHRVNVNEQDTLQTIIQNITKILLEKEIPIINQQLFHFPLTEKSQPLNLQSTIKSNNFRDGEMLQIKYTVDNSRIKPEETDPFKLDVIKDPVPPCYLHGKNASCVRCMTSQYQRINPQEKTKVAGVCVDKKAVSVFQFNVSQNLAFSVQRLGILYGVKDEEGWLKVQCIYEPPQEDATDNVLLINNEVEKENVQKIVSNFGYKKIGCIISQTVEDFQEEDFIFTAYQLLLFGELHRDLTADDDFIILSLGMKENGESELQAFELSERFYDLFNRRYFFPADEKFFLKVKEPLWIQSKEESDIEVEFFIVPGNLKEHDGELRCEFPVENRFVVQTSVFLKELLNKHKKMNIPLLQTLSDFHVLLFLYPHIGASDMDKIVQLVKNKEPIPDGYKMIINVLAGIMDDF